MLYIISDLKESKGMEWVFSALINSLFELHVILLNPEYGNSPLAKYIQSHKEIQLSQFILHSKKDIPFLIWKCYLYMKKHRIDIVHSHLFKGSIIGLISGRLAHVKKNIYTRHHATFHLDYFPNAVKYDRLNNRLASDIVAVSSSVKEILESRENCAPGKIKIIPHGFNTSSFNDVSAIRSQAIKSKYQLPDKGLLIGVSSRYIQWKGIEYIIEAFRRYFSMNRKAFLILAGASGTYDKEIQKSLRNLPANSYREIIFESDNIALYQNFDRFIHVPVNRYCEAFGQVYIEALLSGIPGIFTLSGIANDVVEDRENALVVDYKNSDDILKALLWYDDHPEATKKISERARESVSGRFTIDNMINSLTDLYLGNTQITTY